PGFLAAAPVPATRQPALPGHFGYGPHSTVRTTILDQTNPGPRRRDGADRGIPFRGSLSPSRFRPTAQVLIGRTEWRVELSPWRSRCEYAASPSKTAPRSGLSAQTQGQRESGTTLRPARTSQ